jgi:hypothetical protein
MEMSTAITMTPDLASEIRPLADAEIDAVNGGFLPVLLAAVYLADCFMVGMIIGDYLASP